MIDTKVDTITSAGSADSATGTVDFLFPYPVVLIGASVALSESSGTADVKLSCPFFADITIVTNGAPVALDVDPPIILHGTVTATLSQGDAGDSVVTLYVQDEA